MLTLSSRTVRRLGAGLLAWVVAVVGLAVMVASPARAAGCDANGDGSATGVVEPILTTGSDGAAHQLEEETGLRLAAPERAHWWRVTACVETTPARAVSVIGAPVQERKPEAGEWERDALAGAVDDLSPLLYRPGARTSPHVGGAQFVGLEMWLAIDPASWVPFSATATSGEVDVAATATPSKMVWEFTDGVVRVCDGPGVEYTPGAAGPAPCGRDFDRTTEVQPVTASVRIEYQISWTSSIGGRGTLVQRGEPNRYELKVGEVQTYLTDGQRRADPAPESLPPPVSSQPINDEDCGWATPWDCSPSDILDAVTDLAVDVVWATLPPPVKDALRLVWNFIQGCASFVGDAFGSMQDVFAQFGQLVTDPQRFVSEKLDVAKTIYDGVRADPAGFATEFLGQAVEWDLLQSNPAQWAGKIGCQLAVAVLTGGAAAAGRFGDLLGDVNRFVDRVRDWMGRRDGNGDRDIDVDLCPTSSFPAGTDVLLADGTRRPIEAVRPGDSVLALDPVGGTWAARPVLDQWSYLDTDEMATLVLADGSAVSATDHHQFWSASRGRFAELEGLMPGERLAAAGGRPVVVDRVAVWPSGPTRVWELTVAVDHTFAVFAGEHAVAVHNGCRMPLPDGDIRSALDNDGLQWITVDEVHDAWSRYTGDLAPGTWLDRYKTIRLNAGGGSAYETEWLAKLQVKKNNALFPPDDPTFIPDGVRSTDPPSFVEIKKYDGTTLYPGSNAGAQVEYLIDWAQKNPSGGRPTFELQISNEDNLSDGFEALLTRASRTVTIIVNGKPWVP